VCGLLTETSLSMGEIARQCDFARESHLAFLFRKQHKVTMSEYRVASQRLK
jgi:AraC-like DNA-binding protein